MNYKNSLFIWFFIVVFPLGLYAQQNTLTGVQKMRMLVKENNIPLAKEYLELQIKNFTTNNQPDSLASYIEFVGSYSLNNKNWKFALKNTQTFVDKLLAYNSPRVSKFAYKELAWIQDESGRPDLAYASLEKALVFAKKDLENKTPTVDDLYYNLGYYAAAMGDYALSKKNYLKSLDYFLKSKNKNYISLQQVYNALGGIMWREAKMDSCNYYFAQSLKALEKTQPDIMNKYFRPGLVLMNMAVVSNALGNNNEAITFSEKAITNFQKYIQEETDEQKQNAAQNNLLVTVDNLGSFYNSVGAFNKAESLIAYAYQQKKKAKDINDPNVIISEILLAQAKLNTQKLGEAKITLESALQKIEKNPGVQVFWKASALTTLGNVYKAQNENEKAQLAFEEGISLFLTSTGGKYSVEILTELSNLAVFYAKIGERDKAIFKAKELLREVNNGEFKDTSQGLQFLLAVAETYYQLENYTESQKISNQVINAIENEQKNTQKTSDAILKSFQLPRALLLNTKSTYKLTEDKNISLLKNSAEKIENAFKTLQLRQNILQNYEDVSLLILENKELLDFAKQLQLELYQKTNDNKYLEQLITYHESSIYNRIRARLNLKDIQNFSQVSKEILEQEIVLKQDLSNSLKNNNSEGISAFINATAKWESFIETLKNNYPKYFQLKYGSLLQEQHNWKSLIPDQTTVIRYLFIDENLYALVINAQETKIITIENSLNLTRLIEEQNNLISQQNTLPYKKLYDILWKPLAPLIKTDEVIIVPDGILFNLSFETLTPEITKSYKEFANKSLLTKHTLSYHFSLYLLGEQSINTQKANFIAFAPSFEEKMKQKYLAAIKDSVQLDKSYLTLLPQPFIKEATQKYGRIFKGEVYTNEKASKTLFLEKAKEHKIIHIGTHAESNNLSPELSRLIFAKNLETDSIAENSLYAFEIYNYNLTADLAILTACETGKPSYQPGEGMISLTHAFTYAGSKSILTSLWNIDEKSSTEIVSLFYENLKKGQPKNIALKNAKLSYLNTASGRTLSPQYWAGLILIGDTQALDLKTTNNYLWILLSILLIVVIAYFFFRKK